MGTITDFSDWIDICDLEDHEDVYCLYKAVNDIDELGCYVCVNAKKQNSYIVSYTLSDDSLFLASEKARKAFLFELEKRYCGGSDMESWYVVKKAIAKND